MNLSIIVAMGRNRVIGIDNQLPWLIPADLMYFKSVTMAKPIIMGRKTYDSIGRPLPGRKNIVITRNEGWKADGVAVVHNFASAIKAAEGEKTSEVMVIGGAQIYAEALLLVDKLYVTEVDVAPEGDAYFPEFSNEFQEVSRENHPAEGGKPAYSFVAYQR